MDDGAGERMEAKGEQSKACLVFPDHGFYHGGDLQLLFGIDGRKFLIGRLQVHLVSLLS